MKAIRVIGFQQFVSSALAAAVPVSTELLTDTQGNKANGAWFSVNGTNGAVRFRDDGGVPTAAIGMRIPAALAPFLYTGDLTKLRFIAEGGSTTLEATYVQVTD